MKQLLILSLMMSGVTTLFAQGEATKEETREWIIGNVKGRSVFLTFSHRSGSVSESYNITDVTFNECTGVIVKKRVEERLRPQNNFKLNQTFTYSFSYSDLSKIIIEENQGFPKDSNRFFLKIATLNNMPKINQSIENNKTKVVTQSEAKYLEIEGFDKETAERAKNVFMHYIKLCGGQQERF